MSLCLPPMHRKSYSQMCSLMECVDSGVTSVLACLFQMTTLPKATGHQSNRSPRISSVARTGLVNWLPLHNKTKGSKEKATHHLMVMALVPRPSSLPHLQGPPQLTGTVADDGTRLALPSPS